MEPIRRPVLVVITGPPAAGKTTIARTLAPRLGLPLIAKDDIKEALVDRLGAGDRDWSRRLGSVTFDLMYRITRELLAADLSLMLEGHMLRHLASPVLRELLSDTQGAAVQLFLTVPEPIARSRYAQRAGTPERHPGHLDALVLDEWRSATPHSYEPLDLPGELIEIDTSDFALVDIDAICGSVRAAVTRAQRVRA